MVAGGRADDADAQRPAGILDEGGELLGGLCVAVSDKIVAPVGLQFHAVPFLQAGQPVEDGALAWIKFRNGVRALLGVGSAPPAHPGDPRDPLSPTVDWTYHRIIIHGTTGRLEIDGDAPFQGRPLVRIHRGAEVDAVPLADPYDANGGLLAFAREVATLLDCLDDPSVRHPLEAESARATLELLLAIYESSRRRQLVRLPLDTIDNPLSTMLEEGVI